MKRTFAFVFTLILCLSLFTGCFEINGDKKDFDFMIGIKRDYFRGETVEITATVTNVSGRTYRYVGCSGNDFIPSISMYTESNGEKYYLECDPLVFPCDVVNKKVKNGESGSVVYTFPIPDDAILGKYSVTLSYCDDKREYLEVIRVMDVTSQNEKEDLVYSAVSVSSFYESVKPIQTLAHTTQYAKDGEAFLYGDGMGYYGIFSNPEIKASDYPTVVAKSEVTVSVSDNLKLGNPRVFGKDYEEYKYSHPGWNGLHLLPAGEYFVVFYENTDTRDTNSNADSYWLTTFENVFRLIVPERELGDSYYSLAFNQTYSLDGDYDISTKYRAGERVELRLEMVFEQYYEVTVAGNKAVMIGSDDSYVIYAFIMPEGDARVEIKEVSVEIPAR